MSRRRRPAAGPTASRPLALAPILALAVLAPAPAPAGGMLATARPAPVATNAAEPLGPYWPNAPGASWIYDRVQVEWGPASKTSYTRVQFDLGDSTTIGAGIHVQPLVVSAEGLEHRAAFWQQLAVARPDARSPLAPPGTGSTSGLVIHDGALLRVAAVEIAAYRDAPAVRSWIYLESDVVPGHGFHLQLVPDLADSVFLDGTVLGPTDVTTPAGSFAGALRVRYVVDYGWADVLDTSGGVLGRIRSRTLGEMFYAAGIGPVLARETFVPQLEVRGSPPPPAADSTFAELRLVSSSLPYAVFEASWSALKRSYR